MSSTSAVPCPLTMPVRPSGTRSPWLCLFVWLIGLSVIFGAGAVSGAAAYSYWHHSFLIWVREHPEEVPDLIVDKLNSSLGLSAEQMPLVAEAVRRNHAELEAIQDDIRPRIDQRCVEYEREMEQLLTPAQYAIWLPHFRDARKCWLP